MNKEQSVGRNLQPVMQHINKDKLKYTHSRGLNPSPQSSTPSSPYRRTKQRRIATPNVSNNKKVIITEIVIKKYNTLLQNN
jgi:hypothetical protein